MTVQIYRTTGSDNFGSDFGLKDQIRRASVSVMSNIAEGFESLTNPVFARYLGHAKASAGEIRSQLYLAYDLEYITGEEFDSLIGLVEKISRQLFNLIKYLKGLDRRDRI